MKDTEKKKLKEEGASCGKFNFELRAWDFEAEALLPRSGILAETSIQNARLIFFQWLEAGCVSAEAFAKAGSLHSYFFQTLETFLPTIGKITAKFSKVWKKRPQIFQCLELL